MDDELSVVENLPAAAPQGGGEPAGWAGPSPEEWQQAQQQLAEMGALLQEAYEDRAFAQEIDAEAELVERLDPFDDDFPLHLAGLIAEREQAAADRVLEQVAGALGPVHEIANERLVADAFDQVERQLGQRVDRHAVRQIAAETLRELGPEFLDQIDDQDEFSRQLMHDIATDLLAERHYAGLRDEVEVANAIIGGNLGKPAGLPRGDELDVAMRLIGGAR